MPTETVSLRPAQPDDQQFLLEVYASSRLEELAPVPWTDSQRQAFLQMQFLAQDSYYKERFPDAAYQVILVNNEPAGRLYVLRKEKTIRILDTALLHRYRNTGVGGFLIRGLLDEASKAGKPLQIYVETFNRSLSLFQRLGFEKIAAEGINFLLEWQPR